MDDATIYATIGQQHTYLQQPVYIFKKSLVLEVHRQLFTILLTNISLSVIYTVKHIPTKFSKVNNI